ncbi:MAG TPA: amidohydrolase family protein [Acidimicrobiales bacterium]|nr:amidohydrolase family protein [Acidimicrobiales bacterium]
MYIDADTHCDECEDTWAFMPKELRPTNISLESGEVPLWLKPDPGASSAHSRFWFLDGKLASHRERDNNRSGTTVETRELLDVAARVRDMDELSVEVQVVYPTVLLNELTRRPELEVSLYSSYNEWLYRRCDESGGRLRAVAMIPFGSIPDALEEMKRAKDRGAVGFFKRGVEWDRSASDPYFFPAFELAQSLDLPMCLHSSLPFAAIDPHFARVRPVFTLGFGGITVLQGFYALVADEIPVRFPKLRIGLVEAGSSWVPYLLDILQISRDRDRYFPDRNMYISCETGEDLKYVLDQAGDQTFFVGTDYTHGDRASVMNAHRMVFERPDISRESAERLTSLNAKKFYNL